MSMGAASQEPVADTDPHCQGQVLVAQDTRWSHRRALKPPDSVEVAAQATETTSCDSCDHLCEGMLVRLVGLPVAYEGVLVSFNAASDVWTVRSETPYLEVNPSHLRAAHPPLPSEHAAQARGLHEMTATDGQAVTVSKGLKTKKRSAFIKAATSELHGTYSSPMQLKIAHFLHSSSADAFVSVVILLNLVLICLDIDARAAHPGHPHGSATPVWVSRATDFCYLVFLVELVARVLVERRRFVKDKSNIMDTFIIVMGAVEYVLTFAGLEASRFTILRVLRLARLLRLLRALRLFAALKELRRLLQMMGSCFKTLFWSFLLLILVMTLWAAMAVELINPFVQELADAGMWADCDRCRRSFSSVFDANLTFFQTVVAGDSWGVMAVPVIEAHPWSAAVFAGALMTLVFGVLNLVVAVIVDTFAENRAKDIVQKANEMDYEEIEEKRVLEQIFERIDMDGSGSLSLQELKHGARKVAEFSHWLRVLDIDAADLQQLFQMVDEDGSGEIELHEFVEAMYRMKNTESRTATRFVKHMVAKLDEKQAAMERELDEVKDSMTGGVGALRQAVTNGFKEQERAIVRVASETSAGLARREAELQERLRQQERALQETIEAAVARISEVAQEAASKAMHGVMNTGFLSRKSFAEGLHSRLQQRLLTRAGDAEQSSRTLSSSTIHDFGRWGQQEGAEKGAPPLSAQTSRDQMLSSRGFRGPNGMPTSMPQLASCDLEHVP